MASSGHIPPLHKHTAIYHRKFSPDLKRVNFPWRVLTVFAALQTWFVTAGWLAVRKIAPANVQSLLNDAEHYFFEYATPLINFWQDTAHKAFAYADAVVDFVMVNSWYIFTKLQYDIGNLATYILSIVEHRVSLLQDHGLDGLWMVWKAWISPPRYVNPGVGVVETVVSSPIKTFHQPTPYSSATSTVSYVTSH